MNPHNRQSPAAEPASGDPLPGWGFPEWFVVIQFLSPALLFVPGAQSQRFLIRALPYIASLAGLIYCFGKDKRLPARLGRSRDEPQERPLQTSARWMMVAFAILLLAQLHPDTIQPAGLAQLLFQITIAAPLIWAGRLVRSTAQLARLIWILFLANGLSAVTGLLQAVDPDRFLPPEFSRLGLDMNSYWIESLSYTSASGKRIIRPPGLTDMPGGAAVAGMITGFLGIVLSSLPRTPAWKRLACLSASGVGMSVLYLTQVRSLFLVMLFCLGCMAIILSRQKRLTPVIWLVSFAVLTTIASFDWAARFGGNSVVERFLSLKNEPMIQTYQRSRGHFLTYTVNELLSKHPFGAGIGRWGMMHVYFKPSDPMAPQPIHVEIQLTGWLIDGGMLLWVAYGGAILAAFASAIPRVISRTTGPLPHLAGIVICLNLGVLVQSFAGPAFNTQLGIQFWFLAAARSGVPGSKQETDQGHLKQR